jgi:antitoxin HicB
MLTYPAHIVKDDETFLVTFPDLENVITYGATIGEAIQNAEDALSGCLASDFERNFTIPEPSNITGDDIHPITVAPHVAVAIMLRKMRADASQTEIAKRLNISYQVYQRLENPRKANPTLKTLEKIARVFGKHVELGFV